MPDSRKSVIGDGVLYTKVPEKVDEYLRSIRYLADIMVNAGVNPEILVPKLDVFEPSGGSNSYYESVATDVFVDTGANHVYVFRQPVENKFVKDGTFQVDELDDRLKTWLF